jgi:hypothetical protein
MAEPTSILNRSGYGMEQIIQASFDSTFGALKFTPNGVAAATATLSNVSSSASTTTILSANTGRVGMCLHNDSTAVLYLKCGATASTSSYTVKIPADSYYEMPFNYTGRIDGIWASANGNARVTEFT